MDREPAACNLVGGRAATAKIDERGLRFRVYNRSLDHGLARGLQLGTQTTKRIIHQTPHSQPGLSSPGACSYLGTWTCSSGARSYSPLEHSASEPVVEGCAQRAPFLRLSSPAY